jgi:protoporphyrinogen oxidase
LEKRKIIIVGAGIGGLAAAYWLLQRGFEVEILEATNRPGGRMVTIERNGDRVDVGAQFYHSNYRYAFEFMTVLGMNASKRSIEGDVKYVLKDGSTYIWDRRIPYMKLLGLGGNLKMYEFVLKHVAFGYQLPAYRIEKDIPEYDNIGVLDAFSSPSDSSLRDYFIKPVSMGMSSALPEWTSFYHFINMFKNIMLYKHISLTQGVASLAEELARHLPVEYENPVRRIVIEKGRIVGVQIEKDNSVRRAAHVIVAVTPPAAASLLPEEMSEQRRFFDSVLYAQLAMPVFFLDRPLNKDIWCYFNYPGVKRDFVFAIDQHFKAPEMSPSGKSILTGWAVHPTAAELMDESDEVTIKKAQEDIELMIPGFSKWIEEVRVHRHAFVNALYPPGAYRSVLDFKESAKRLQGVSFVSSALGGTSIEAAIISAADAVKKVCGWGGISS